MTEIVEYSERKRIQEELDRIAKKILNNPELQKEAEEYQRKYGTLTGDDLRKMFTI